MSPVQVQTVATICLLGVLAFHGFREKRRTRIEHPGHVRKA